MSSKRRLSKSLSPELTNIDTTETELEDSLKSNLCLICGDKARIINYGALSCQSCKTFFRRNGFRPETVRPCIFNGHCEVNMQTRHNCTACRLAKCFAVGMSSDLIRKEDHKKVKISSSAKLDGIEQSPSQQIRTRSQVTTWDLVQEDRSILTDSEWTLLSNILSAYDTYSIVSQVCDTIGNLSILPTEASVDMINPLEIFDQIFISIQSFIGSLPDFRILTISEQTSLLKRNLHGIITFYSILFFRSTKILYNVKCMEAYTSIYGAEIMSLAKHANDQLDPDSTLIKLMLIIFAFSSHCFIVDHNIELDSLRHGTFRLLGSQNAYLELLWKYMVYRYGHNESVHRLSRLIQTFLCVLKKSAFIYMNNEVHQNMVDNNIEKIKQSLVISKNEQMPLWGKTLIVEL